MADMLRLIAFVSMCVCLGGCNVRSKDTPQSDLDGLKKQLQGTTVHFFFPRDVKAKDIVILLNGVCLIPIRSANSEMPPADPRWIFEQLITESAKGSIRFKGQTYDFSIELNEKIHGTGWSIELFKEKEVYRLYSGWGPRYLTL